jgi:hypothetical protein
LSHFSFILKNVEPGPKLSKKARKIGSTFSPSEKSNLSLTLPSVVSTAHEPGLIKVEPKDPYEAI